MSDAQRTRNRPRGKHERRTALVFFGLTVQAYLQVVTARVHDVAVVAPAWRGCSTLQHRPDCPGPGRFTRHHHDTRTAHSYEAGLYELPIWQVRCLGCRVVLTVWPRVLLRSQRFDAGCAQRLREMAVVMHVSYRHTNIMLGSASPTTFAPAVYWRLILWLGQVMPVTRVLLRLGLTPPRYIITDEKFTDEAGRRPYVPAIVQQELLWAIDSVEQSDEATLHVFFQAFLTEVQAMYRDYRLRGALQDGWQPAQEALQAVCPQVVLGECHLHAQSRTAQALVKDHKPHPEVSPAALQALQTRHDHALEAPRLFNFAQRLRRLPDVFRTDPLPQKRYASLQRKKQRLTAWTTKPLPKTTTALDQLFKFLERKLFSMQTLRTGVSARATANAWAIVRNFWRYLPGRSGQDDPLSNLRELTVETSHGCKCSTSYPWVHGTEHKIRNYVAGRQVTVPSRLDSNARRAICPRSPGLVGTRRTSTCRCGRWCQASRGRSHTPARRARQRAEGAMAHGPPAPWPAVHRGASVAPTPRWHRQVRALSLAACRPPVCPARTHAAPAGRVAPRPSRRAQGGLGGRHVGWPGSGPGPLCAGGGRLAGASTARRPRPPGSGGRLGAGAEAGGGPVGPPQEGRAAPPLRRHDSPRAGDQAGHAHRGTRPGAGGAPPSGSRPTRRGDHGPGAPRPVACRAPLGLGPGGGP
jgi:hypothetical protein